MTEVKSTTRLGETLRTDIPNDVLQTIFLYCAFEDDEDDALSSDSDDSYRALEPRQTVLSCSQVCRHWRSSALDYPQIWSLVLDFDRNSVPWIEQLLRRCPTLIDCRSYFHLPHLDNTREEEIAAILFERSDSLQTLNLSFDSHSSTSWPWHKVFYPNTTREFPHLSTLCLLSRYADIGWELPPFNLDAFVGCATSLLQVEFSGIPFDLAPLKSATNLQRARFKWGYNLQPAPSLTEWLQFLSCTPQLQYLSLTDSISNSSHTARSAVALHRLQMLSLKDAAGPCIFLATQLIVPDQCGLLLSCTSFVTGGDEQGLYDLIHSRVGCWDMLDHESKRSLDARHDQGISDQRRYEPNHESIDNYQVYIGNLIAPRLRWKFIAEAIVNGDGSSINGGNNLTDPCLMIRIRLDVISEPIEPIARIFNTCVSLFQPSSTTLLKLWMQSRDDLVGMDEMRGLSPILSSFKNLTVLEISEWAIDSLVGVLQEDSHMLLPFLRKIRIRPDNRRMYLQSTPLNSKELVRFLQWRKQAQRPIQTIDLRECTLGPAFRTSGLAEEVEVLWPESLL